MIMFTSSVIRMCDGVHESSIYTNRLPINALSTNMTRRYVAGGKRTVGVEWFDFTGGEDDEEADELFIPALSGTAAAVPLDLDIRF